MPAVHAVPTWPCPTPGSHSCCLVTPTTPAFHSDIHLPTGGTVPCADCYCPAFISFHMHYAMPAPFNSLCSPEALILKDSPAPFTCLLHVLLFRWEGREEFPGGYLIDGGRRREGKVHACPHYLLTWEGGACLHIAYVPTARPLTLPAMEILCHWMVIVSPAYTLPRWRILEGCCSFL